MSPTEESEGVVLAARKLGYHPPSAPKPLLTDVSIDLRAGQCGLVTGISGSGKTTLLRVLSGLAPGGGETGQVCVDGKMADTAARRRAVGVVFQQPSRHFVADTLVAEFTYAWPPADKEPREVRLRRAAEVQGCLALLGLASLPLDAKLDTLSGGQQRRVAIAAQLARQPHALLLDEPFAGLDWRSRQGLLPLLRAAARDTNRAVLIVSHDNEELRAVADAEWRMDVGGTCERIL
ncbi:hypothetical protein PPROV_000377800 [Pycnococcus provasolii]|uniref:ABC transporter domain-containing protein n=1 Tax=Pycnococcus provasolii TaxID=41880 RepID=A0A830HCD1_9CHLO|nr:hypothetical protein PPROV_000377800 [Pycnococcus provasolii]